MSLTNDQVAIDNRSLAEQHEAAHQETIRLFDASAEAFANLSEVNFNSEEARENKRLYEASVEAFSLRLGKPSDENCRAHSQAVEESVAAAARLEEAARPLREEHKRITAELRAAQDRCREIADLRKREAA